MDETVEMQNKVWLSSSSLLCVNHIQINDTLRDMGVDGKDGTVAVVVCECL